MNLYNNEAWFIGWRHRDQSTRRHSGPAPQYTMGGEPQQRRTWDALRPHIVIQIERLRAPNRVVREGCLEEGNTGEIINCFSRC